MQRFTMLKMLFVGMMAMTLLSCAGPQQQAVVDDDASVQVISVHTPGVTGAHCFLQAGGLSYPVAAPGKVAVRKSGKAMDVTCFKGEHMIGNAQLRPLCSINCGYPASVTVAMALDATSMERQVSQFYP